MTFYEGKKIQKYIIVHNKMSNIRLENRLGDFPFILTLKVTFFTWCLNLNVCWHCVYTTTLQKYIYFKCPQFSKIKPFTDSGQSDVALPRPLPRLLMDSAVLS